MHTDVHEAAAAAQRVDVERAPFRDAAPSYAREFAVGDLSQRAGRDKLLRLQPVGRKAHGLACGEQQPLRLGQREQRLGVFIGQRHRLLADHMRAGVQRHLDVIAVEAVGHADHHEVGFRIGEELRRIVGVIGDPVPCGGIRGGFRVFIAYADDPEAVRAVLQRGNVGKIGHHTGADQRNFQQILVILPKIDTISGKHSSAAKAEEWVCRVYSYI